MFDITIPATLLSLSGAWFTSSSQWKQRRLGFGLWIASNAIFVAWAASMQFWWIAAMYVCFQITSIKGFIANRKAMEAVQ